MIVQNADYSVMRCHEKPFRKFWLPKLVHMMEAINYTAGDARPNYSKSMS